MVRNLLRTKVMVGISQEHIDHVIEGLDTLLERLNDSPQPFEFDGDNARDGVISSSVAEPDPAPDKPILARGSGPRQRPEPRSETVAVALPMAAPTSGTGRPISPGIEPNVANQREIARYFEYSNHGIEVVADGLQEVPFGEFLVAQNALTRFELLRALQLQDQTPDRRLGECVIALGFLAADQVSDYLRTWNGLDVVVVGPDAD